MKRAAENSTGLHNPEYALKILAESTTLARQAQMLAAQSVNDMTYCKREHFIHKQLNSSALLAIQKTLSEEQRLFVP
ncbi:MAG TPA: ammonia-forming cytochrome c nitrite reductase subunit c552 [Anaerolineales bacterium]|nr:ammonia-forming cytochrome c nitrite reductase subunit c552 [Anaerolineales bacterium]